MIAAGKRFLLVFFLTTILIAQFDCMAFSPLVGKWQDSITSNTLEFTYGGDVIVNSSGFLTTGKYQLVGSDVIKLQFDGVGQLITLFGNAWQYKISGDDLTITAGGRTSVYKRFKTKSTQDLTPAQKQKAASDELIAVRTALLAMMTSNDLTNLPANDIATSGNSTNNMSIFPSSIYHLYGMNLNGRISNYFDFPATTGTYSVDPWGYVIQVTTGY